MDINSVPQLGHLCKQYHPQEVKTENSIANRVMLINTWPLHRERIIDLADLQNESMSPKKPFHTQWFYKNILDLNSFPQPKVEYVTIFVRLEKKFWFGKSKYSVNVIFKQPLLLTI